MIGLLADENLDGPVIDALRRANPQLDLVRVQDTHLYQKDDPTILAWAADQNRVLLTHDFKTMPDFVRERFEQNLLVSGIIFIPKSLPVNQVVEELLIALGATNDNEWQDVMLYLPL